MFEKYLGELTAEEREYLKELVGYLRQAQEPYEKNIYAAGVALDEGWISSTKYTEYRRRQDAFVRLYGDAELVLEKYLYCVAGNKLYHKWFPPTPPSEEQFRDALDVALTCVPISRYDENY